MALQRPVLWEGVSNATGMDPDWEISPPRVTIHALPDEILLKIFDSCRVALTKAPYLWSVLWTNTWRNLVHVCQRWRYVVFSSPFGLDLRLYCTDRTSVRNMLDVWPPFPIEIRSLHLGDDIIATLEHHDRVCILGLYLSPYSRFERLVTVMRNPFPALIQLRLTGRGKPGPVPVLPDTFLGGSAPHLQSLTLEGVAFPTLPQLLLSSNGLSELFLYDIPDLGYISPEAMATGLSGLTRLTVLTIRFEKGTILGRARLPSLTHALLPALTMFNFCGLDEYLEDLLARIDTPQINRLYIRLFHQPVIDIRQLISRSRPLGSFDRAKVKFDYSTVLIKLHQSEGTDPSVMELEIGHIPMSGRQLSSLEQICTQSSSLLSSITELIIMDTLSFFVSNNEDDSMNHPGWLILFDLFTAARTLHLFGWIQRSIIPFLGGLTRERAIELLPKLQNIYICDVRETDWIGEFEEPMEKFIAARQHSDHPVTWEFASASTINWGPQQE